MNKTTSPLRAEFRPETRLEIRPVPAVPFRATLENEFERLKNRLLAETLDETGHPGLNVLLRRSANEAAALAWVTYYPLLVFPTLFEEKARVAVRQAKRQARVYAGGGELVAA